MEFIGPFHEYPEAGQLFLTLFFVFASVMALTVLIIKLLIFCKIFFKAGYSWALGLLVLVPIVNIIMYFVLAFADWPVEKELRLLKQQQVKPVT